MHELKNSDQDVLRRIINNDNKAVRSFYSKNFGFVIRMVLDAGGTKEDAEDLMQEAMLIFLNNVNKEGFKLTSSLNTYFISICKKKWLEISDRKKKLNEAASNMDFDKFETISPELFNISKETRSIVLHEGINNLDLKCQNIIKMRLREISYEYIVDKLKLHNVPQARKLKHNCIHKLFKVVKKHKFYNYIKND